MEHVDRQTHHGKVINDKHEPEVHRLSVPHEFGSEPDDAKVAEENTEDGNGGVNEQPWVGSLIWNQERREIWREIWRQKTNQDL